MDIGRERFIEILHSKGLSEATCEAYIYYYDALQSILQSTGKDLNQEVLEIFLNGYKGASPCRAFLKIYIEEGKRDDLKIPKRTGRMQKKKRQYITPEEVKAIGKELMNSHPRYILMLYLTYECALRRKETVEIRVPDFNWNEWKQDPEKRGKLTITAKGAKGKKERWVSVPSNIMKAIYAYISDYSSKLDDEDPLFQISKKRWSDVFTRAAKKTINRDVSLHDLRFSKATYWYRQGIDIRRIKMRLGHSRIETTYRYIDPAEEEAMEEWMQED